MCCAWLAGNAGRKNDAKNRHLLTITQLCQAISLQLGHYRQSEKKLVKDQYLFHISSQNGELWPTSSWDRFRVWGTPANFNGFCILASLLQERRSPEANQTLLFARCLAVSLDATLLYIFEGSCPLMEFRHVQNSLCVQALRSRVLAALLHCTKAAASAKLCGVIQGMELQNFRRWRHLYSAGRPSRWALAHILVYFKTRNVGQCPTWWSPCRT